MCDSVCLLFENRGRREKEWEKSSDDDEKLSSSSSSFDDDEKRERDRYAVCVLLPYTFPALLLHTTALYVRIFLSLFLFCLPYQEH